MVRLAIRSLVLATPFLAFLAWFELARGGRDTNLFIVKRRLLEAAAPKVEVLTLGASHAHEGILPLLVTPETFNLGAVSQSLYYDAELLRTYAPRLPKLRLVVLPISYFTPEYELDHSIESWRTYYYHRYHGIPHHDGRNGTHLRNFSDWFLYGRDIGLAAVRGQKPGSIRSEYDTGGGRLDTRPLGERVLHPGPDHVRTSAPVAFGRHDKMMSPEFFPANKARLGALLGWLQARGISVVFVTLPVSPGYLALERPGSRERTRAALDGFRRKFGVAWHDYSGDPRFIEDDFWDADHLNFQGADKFSRLLGDEVVKPILARPDPER